MPSQHVTVLNAERTLFVVLTALFGLFLWRATHVEPLPNLPGTPRQTGVKMIEGYLEPSTRLAAMRIPDFWAAGVRNPFAPAFDSLRVVAASLVSTVRITPTECTADVRIEYRILPQPVSEFQVLLPPDVKLLRVDGSGVISRTQPDVKNLGQDGNLYVIRLRSPVDKKYLLGLQLAWNRKMSTQTVQIPEVLLPDATHEHGVVGISAAPGLQVSIKNMANVTAVPQANLPPELNAQGCFAAFRYNSHPYSIELDAAFAIVKFTHPDTTTIVVPPVKPAPGLLTTTNPTKTPTILKPWQLPVKFMGTVTVGSRRCVLLEDKGGNVIQKFEGDPVLGMTIVEISPTTAILKNEKGELFKFKDKASDDYEY